MRSAGAFYVFSKWKRAKEFAFGSQTKPSVVPPEDKAAYSAIFDELKGAAEAARDAAASGHRLELKPMNFSPIYGSRGHRPVDMWVSLCGAGSEALGQMPQIYAIASDRGLEIGFAVSINEADYHDARVKARNRRMVPVLYGKLPGRTDPMVQAIDDALANAGGWRFNAKTRLLPGEPGWGAFSTLADLLSDLKTAGSASGGGAVCRVFGASELAELDLSAEFATAVQTFLPLIARCAPTPWDEQVLRDQDQVEVLAEDLAFDPDGIVDDRRIILAAVAQRQGQAAFRQALFKAYDGRCAVTGTAVAAVLQAAHITPYLGAQTNHVTNGLLLRADIHTLFDLRLLRIVPETLRVEVADALRDTAYADLAGRRLALAAKPSQRPSLAALRQQYEQAGAGSIRSVLGAALESEA